MTQPSETDSIAKSSDPATWIDAYGDVLFRFARARLRVAEEAEDAVQDALLAALKARRDFRGDAQERTWLIGILRHKILDRIRATTAEDGRPPACDEDLLFDDFGRWRRPPGSWPDDPARVVGDAEFGTVLESCLDDLPAAQARAIALRTLDGLSAAEVGKVLGASATNVWVMLHRARIRLRSCLESKWFRNRSCS